MTEAPAEECAKRCDDEKTDDGDIAFFHVDG